MKGRWSHHMAGYIYMMIGNKQLSKAMRNKHGYTILEVMIFLAVTTALFAMLAGSISGRQRSAEFSTSAREMESIVQDIANDITTGYYNNSGNFICKVVAGTPVITSGSAKQGTNSDCILVGRAIDFKNSSFPNGDNFITYSIAGARQVNSISGLRDVEGYDEAKPVVIPSSADTLHMPIGLRITSMYIEGGNRINGIGFFTTFNKSTESASALNINVIPLTGANSSAIIANIKDINTYNSGNVNPAKGITLCMDGLSSNQHALLKIGSDNSRLTTDLIIGNDTCASGGYPA